MSARSSETNPPENAKIHFLCATIFARAINVDKKPISFTGCHRGQRAKCDEGYMIIDKQWYPA